MSPSLPSASAVAPPPFSPPAPTPASSVATCVSVPPEHLPSPTAHLCPPHPCAPARRRHRGSVGADGRLHASAILEARRFPSAATALAAVSKVIACGVVAV